MTGCVIIKGVGGSLIGAMGLLPPLAKQPLSTLLSYCATAACIMPPAADEAFVTLATNDSYAKGALVLAHSLHQQGTTRQLAILVTPHVSPAYRSALRVTFDLVQEVDVMESGDSAHLSLMQRPELGVTLTKIHCWTLTQYSKAVFMDADTMAVAPLDDLFDREELSAAPDPGWPDCFNSGLFVFRPSLDTYSQLLEMARSTGSFDGGDQGLLNTFFSRWATENIERHLPFTYNLSIASVYSYMPAFKRFGGDVKVVHFLGAVKPWHCRYDSKSGTVASSSSSSSSSSSDLSQQPQPQQPQPQQQHLPHHANFLQRWWQLFHGSVLPTLPADAAAGVEVSSLQWALSSLSVAAHAGSEGQQQQQGQQGQQQEEEHRRRLQWERGQADYLGVDAFKHIQSKLDSQLK
ncbi:glycogenin-1 isoform X2 [Petromyzon marinus]|uniref:glycogenin-1 isoform X2 n=2 Tax=Petromyzon marinus TaxID=7757 RepID=UPI003F6FBFDA